MCFVKMLKLSLTMDNQAPKNANGQLFQREDVSHDRNISNIFSK